MVFDRPIYTAFATTRIAKRRQWYPTSREKRARCGAPRICVRDGSRLLATAYRVLSRNTTRTIRTTSKNAFKTNSIGIICWSLLCGGSALAATLGAGIGGA